MAALKKKRQRAGDKEIFDHWNFYSGLEWNQYRAARVLRKLTTGNEPSRMTIFAGSVFGFFVQNCCEALFADCRHQQLLHQTGAVACRGKGHAKLLIVRTIDQRFLRGKLP